MPASPTVSYSLVCLTRFSLQLLSLTCQTPNNESDWFLTSLLQECREVHREGSSLVPRDIVAGSEAGFFH